MTLALVKRKTKHPCAGMTPAQKRDFERIAINEHPLGGAMTINKLLARGVIREGEPKIRRDNLGEFKVRQWFVPTSVHMQWCKWASEQKQFE